MDGGAEVARDSVTWDYVEGLSGSPVESSSAPPG
jgi:hypothetical protein